MKDGDVVTFKIRVSVSGEGEGFGRIKLRYDPSKAITKDEWAPQSCMDSAKGVVDGFAEGEITCIDDPTDATGCTVINGIKVCESQLAVTFARYSKTMQKVRVKADYDFYKGQMDCWTDPQGETHCPVNTGGNLDSCQKYEENLSAASSVPNVLMVLREVLVRATSTRILMTVVQMFLFRP